MSQDKIDILQRALQREKTARKQAEKILEDKSRELFFTAQELQKSNSQLEKLLDEKSSQLSIIVNNSSLGIVLTQNEKVLKSNKSAQDFFGYTEKEFLDLTIYDISFEEDLQQAKDLFLKFKSGGLDNFVLNKRYKNKNGSAIWSKTNINAVKSNNGEINYFVIIIEDITLQREKNMMLDVINNVAKSVLGKIDLYEIAWELTTKIANFLETEDCAIYLVDNKEQTLEQIAAYGQKVSQNKEIINKLVIPIGNGIVGSVAKTGKAEIINDTGTDSRYIIDDEVRLSEITVPIIYDNEVIGIIDSEHTEKNHFTHKHLDVLTKIANLVVLQIKNAIALRDLKAAEIKNTNLLKELEVSNQELQDYAHIVSHDLKSPLRSISALISWTKEDYTHIIDEKGLENFNLIEGKVEKMDQLIDGILKYSSIDKKKIANQKVDLNQVVETIIETIFIPKHVKVVVTNKLPVIVNDQTRILQLFQNLISNAVNYIDKDNGLVEIDFQDKKTHYEFSIKDNGVGISEKYHRKIFEIFKSVDESGSTGIGLSIVKKIVDLNHGKIWLDSTLGEGTTFYFTLKKK